MTGSTEHSPLLQNGNRDLESHEEGGEEEEEVVKFEKEDEENPRQWTHYRKTLQVGIIFLMAILCPLTSSIFTAAIDQIEEDFDTDKTIVVGGTTGFVVMLGVGPLILAPLSETFGRRKLYLICFFLFTLMQIPTALSPNVEAFIVFRTLGGFFGSVGVANGGGSISDMFDSKRRASVLGWYLLGPLLGPTIGPLFGGIIVSKLNWRWMFWILTIACSLVFVLGYFCLCETYAPVILQARKASLAQKGGKKYRVDGEDSSPLWSKLLHASQRPLRILFTQPIVLIMSAYQAVIFSTMYSLYTNFQDIWSDRYGFSTVKVGLTYLGPALGFLLAVILLIPYIDKIYNSLAESTEDGEGRPEFRLPLANVGAVLLPISLFWFAWCVEYRVHWFPTLSATFFFGAAQVSIFNTVQNYYIDSFEKYAASAIAAGAFLRSVIGGTVPLFVPKMFDKLGYGWGMSVFGFLSLALMPVPLGFYYFGARIRERFAIEL